MRELIKRMEKEVIIRGLSNHTKVIYLRQLQQFMQYLKKSPEDVTLEDITEYQYHLKKKDISWSLFNQTVCAIRFFYLNVLKKDWKVNCIPYSKRKKKLPIVLSKEEVIKLFSCITYPKHKAMFLMMYSTGIRASELVDLKISSIDSKRMLIRITEGKGGKDRYVVLSPKLLKYLREYWKSLKVKPEKWLFPGVSLNKKMCRKTVYSFIKDIQKRSDISKNIHPHTLRHTFATHLLEAGVDLKRIQILMGHTCLRTTSIYFHVAKDYISKVKTPLDLIELV